MNAPAAVAQRPPREWSVYVDDRYVGTVMESSESGARCAAILKFDPPWHAEVSVSPR